MSKNNYFGQYSRIGIVMIIIIMVLLGQCGREIRANAIDYNNPISVFSNLANNGITAIEQEGSIYWATKARVGISELYYRTVGWQVDFKNIETGLSADFTISFGTIAGQDTTDSDLKVTSVQQVEGGRTYQYVLYQIPSEAINQRMKKQGVDIYNLFGNTIELKFNAIVAIMNGEEKVLAGPYNLKHEDQRSTFYSELLKRGFSSVSIQNIRDNYVNKVIYFEGENILPPSYVNQIHSYASGFQIGTTNTGEAGLFLLELREVTKRGGEKFSLGEHLLETIPKGFVSPSVFGTGDIEGSYHNGYDINIVVEQREQVMKFDLIYFPEEYTITYELDGGINDKRNPTSYTILYGISLYEPNRAGYIFEGWYLGEEKITGINEGRGAEFNHVQELYEELSKRTVGDVVIRARWKLANIHVAYMGNNQSAGADLFEEDVALYHQQSEMAEYQLFDNANDEDLHFTKEKEVSYVDQIYGTEMKQRISETVVGWSFKKQGDEALDAAYELGQTYSGVKLLEEATSEGGATKANPHSDFGTNSKVEHVKIPENRNQDIPIVNLYAVWDEGPRIEAYDIYITLDEIKNGHVDEAYVLGFASAADREDGELDNQESFYVANFDSLESVWGVEGEADVIYEAIDSVGNLTQQQVKMHIIDGSLKFLEEDLMRLRFVEEEFLHTIDSKSIWSENTEYSSLLKETLGVLSSGELEHSQEVWVIEEEDINQMQEYIQQKGLGSLDKKGLPNPDNLIEFREEFRRCWSQP